MGNKLIPRVKNILYLKSTIFYDKEQIIDCGQHLFQINVNCLIAKTKKVSLFFYLLTLSIKVSMHLASIQTDKHESFFPKQIQLYKYLCTFSISKKAFVSEELKIDPCLLLLLLLSRISRVRLCATLEKAAHQAPPSLGFSRQEHWSGLPFPSPTHASEK